MENGGAYLGEMQFDAISDCVWTFFSPDKFCCARRLFFGSESTRAALNFSDLTKRFFSELIEPQCLAAFWEKFGGGLSLADFMCDFFCTDISAAALECEAKRVANLHKNTAEHNTQKTDSYFWVNNSAVAFAPFYVCTMEIFTGHKFASEAEYASSLKSDADLLRAFSKIEHNRWCAFLISRGWRAATIGELEHGEIKCPQKKIHACITPFEKLYALSENFGRDFIADDEMNVFASFDIRQSFAEFTKKMKNI